MDRVIVESPFAGKNDFERERNILYARRAVKDSLERGEAPFASHLLYTQDGILNDDVLEERMTGIEAGLEWGKEAHKSAIYIDYGISSGMRQGVLRAQMCGRPIEMRQIGQNP